MFLKSWLGTFQQRLCESCTEHHTRLLAPQGSGSAWVMLTCQRSLGGHTALRSWLCQRPCLHLVRHVRKRKRLANASGMRFRLRLLSKRESLQPSGGSTKCNLDSLGPWEPKPQPWGGTAEVLKELSEEGTSWCPAVSERCVPCIYRKASSLAL